MVFGAAFFFLQSNQSDFFFRKPQLYILKDRGVSKVVLSVKIELGTLEVKFYAKIYQISKKNLIFFKLNDFH